VPLAFFQEIIERLAHSCKTSTKRESIRTVSSLTFICSVVFVLIGASSSALAFDVTQYHYDVQRSGWNNQESTLNVGAVSSNFGLLGTVTLPADEQVDAQPLVVSAATFASKGITTIGGAAISGDIVYVATSQNNVYAIDSTTRRILLTKNFGTAVAIANLPGKCSNNYLSVGITSTPVIDIANKAMFFIAYTWENGAAVYRIHKVDITTLADIIVPAPIITATGALSDGSTTPFQAGSQRQRAALLLANGNVYAGFASFCDFNSQYARGWLLGWTTASLAPLASVELTEQQTSVQAATAYGAFYLSSIWMSGYGPAADSATGGNIYFLTGNSNGNAANNLTESAVKISGDLSTPLAHYTRPDYAKLDAGDQDFGSGGLMVIPGLSGAPPTFAVGGGKDGLMYLFNLADMTSRSNVSIGPCWCGPSYFVGADGKSRVVSSGGVNAKTWLAPTTSTGTLSLEGTSPGLQPTGSQWQDPGFMTSVSSNGTAANSAVIWAISRPDSGGNLKLYAFNGAANSGNLALLKSLNAGLWKSNGNNSNIVPIVANGKVFAASHSALNIYGYAASPPPLAPVITSSLSASATNGFGFTYTITATNNPTSFSAAPLHGGLHLSGATISGTPTVTGTFNITIGAANAKGANSKTLVLTIGRRHRRWF
jgi:hypothetical protein